MSTQILILGSGGREHALAWKLAQSSSVKHIFVCPGNPGSAKNQKTSNLHFPLIHPYNDLVDFAVNKKVFSQSTPSDINSYPTRSIS